MCYHEIIVFMYYCECDIYMKYIYNLFDLRRLRQASKSADEIFQRVVNSAKQTLRRFVVDPYTGL